MTAMQISQIVLVVVLFLALIVKCFEVDSLECEIEEKEIMYKIVIGFKGSEIAELKRMLEAYEDMDREPYKETEDQPHD